MSRIKSIQIHNFKFFDEQSPLDLTERGKHLLIYGENGSGKSSIYWALYTLFECAAKDNTDEIKKYFKHHNEHEESLINIYADKVTETNGDEHYRSFIKIATTDVPPINYEVSLLNTNISGIPHAIEVNLASDFINYKQLFKFQDFWNGERIDLAKIFENSVLPYMRFSEFNLYRNGKLQPRTNAYEMWEEIQKGPGTTKNHKGNTIQVYKYSPENQQFDKFAEHFDDEFEKLIEFINANAPDILKKLGYDIDFELKYHKHTHKKKDSKYSFSPFSIDLKITKYLGKRIDVHRPQSFLNEAKMMAIAIAIRLTILKKRVNEQAPDIPKFIVFDDVMISLDMSNRDRFMNFLLNKNNKFTDDYQIFFLTHDKNLFDFVAHKIKQWDKQDNWIYKEIYVGKDGKGNKEYPLLIDSDLEFIDKAQKHFKANDYTAASIYVRKELEKIVNERLPNELKYKSDGNYLSLQTLWLNMIERYSALGEPVSEDIKKRFAETKLMVLNPQAHFQQISMPIYRIELEKAFKLIDDIKVQCPISKSFLLLSIGMILEFKHPTESYTFKFELLGDFCLGKLGDSTTLIYPKCKVLHFQFNGTDFWDFKKGAPCSPESIKKVLNRKDEMDKIFANLTMIVQLGIDNKMIEDNTNINNGLWSLKEVLDKAGVTL